MSDSIEFRDRVSRKRLNEEIIELLEASDDEDVSDSSESFAISDCDKETSSDDDSGESEEDMTEEQVGGVNGCGGKNGGGPGSPVLDPMYVWGGNGAKTDLNCTEQEEVHLVTVEKPIGDLTIPEMYQLIVTDDIIDYMVECTNENAKTYLLNHSIKRSSRYSQWTNTTKEEMKRFIGLRLYMGLVKMPSYKNYWSDFTIYQNSVVRRAMTRKRFELILRFWHFGPDGENQGRLHKILPLIEKLEKNFTTLKTPGKDLVVDESMIKFRGRLAFRQYNPQKASKYGIKVFKICDPCGYTYKVQVYQGKGTHEPNGSSGTSMATQVVMKLAEPYLDSGRIMCTDNFYTSMELVTALQDRKTHLIGTVRKNRKHLPKEVMTAKLKKGESTSLTERNTGAVALKWKDKREVHMLSTVYDPQQKTVNIRSGREVKKPEIIIEYNRMKGGIDIADTLESYHNPERKSVRWYHKVADSFLFGTSVVNAFLLWNCTRRLGEKKASLEYFRRVIAEKFLEIEALPVKQRTAPLTNHYLNVSQEKDSSGRPRRGRCRGCYQKLPATLKSTEAKNKAKKVHTQCATCTDKPYYCMPCFKEAHVAKE